MVLPDVAVFGAKDFQQAAVIRRMVRDLNFRVKIIVGPIVREADGLAMSSRNRYLEGDRRTQARALSQALRQAQAVVRRAGRGVKALSLKKQLREFIELQPAARVDYIEFFDPETLRPLSQVRRGAHLALAVFIGQTRLIDNARL
jgi:pantoate--beta-alanine ligase